MKPTAPNIFDYSDPVNFVIETFEFQKASTSELTLRKWAKHLGLNSSEALFAVANRKKSLSVSVASQIAVGLSMGSSQKKYFEVLTRLAKETSPTEKRVLEMILEELRLLRGSVKLVDDLSIFSHWVHMAIMSLSRIPGIQISKKNVRSLLIDDVPQETIDAAVDRLIGQGLLRVEGSGRLLPVYDHTSSKSDDFKKPAHQYFAQVSDLAKRGAQSDASVREFQCFSVNINSARLPEFKEAIRNFRAKIAALSALSESDQVYQMNMQFFPLSKVLTTKEEQLLSETAVR